MPVAGLEHSDIPAVSGYARLADPFGAGEVWVVPPIRPDWAIIHVQEADARGNGRIYGSQFWDRLMARAARSVILTAERIVPSEELARQPELTAVPELFVAAVVHCPGGAAPGSCHGHYDIDRPAVERYLSILREPDGMARHLAEWHDRDSAPAREQAALTPADRGSAAASS